MTVFYSILTGGRNGYGAKLCNIFSDKFIVETSSKEYGKKYRQVGFKRKTFKYALVSCYMRGMRSKLTLHSVNTYFNGENRVAF